MVVQGNHNRLTELRNQRNELKNRQRTPETRKELKKLDKQIKHEEKTRIMGSVLLLCCKPNNWFIF